MLLILFLLLLLFVLLSLLLSYLSLLVEFHNTDQPDQSNHPDDASYSSSSTGLSEISSARGTACITSDNEIPDPAAVGDHGDRRDDVQPEEEGVEIILLRPGRKQDFSCKTDNTEQRDSVENIILLLFESQQPDIVEEQGVDGDERHENNDDVVVQNLSDSLLELLFVTALLSRIILRLQLLIMFFLLLPFGHLVF